MSNKTALVLGALGAAALGAWWYFSRGSGGSTAQLATPNVGPLNTSGWSLGGAADSALSSVTTSAQSIGDSIMNAFEPRGIRNNNPLNLRYIADPARAWNGQVGNDAGYGIYSTPALGVRAASKQLQEDFANGDQTLGQLITTWAPPSENDTAAYISDVATRTGIDPNATLDLYANLPAILSAMTWHENGVNPYTSADFQTWAYLA